MEVPLVNHAVKSGSTSTEEYRGAVHKNFLRSVTCCPAPPEADAAATNYSDLYKPFLVVKGRLKHPS